MVTDSIRIVPAERTAEAIAHLVADLAEYACVAYPEAEHVAVRLDVPSRDEWKRLVTTSLAKIDLESYT